MKALKHFKYERIILAFALISFLFACRPARFIQKDKEQLLNKLEIKINDQKNAVDSDDIDALIRQKPNRKMANLIRFHLWVYNSTNQKIFSKKASTGFKRKLNGIIGEAPIVYDSLKTKESLSQIDLFLQKKGYYNNVIEVLTQRKLLNKKKVNLTYNLTLNDAKLIHNVDYDFNQDEFKDVLLNPSTSHIKTDIPFDVDLLKEEQDRIYKTLKSNGYYHFTKQYIKVLADTLQHPDSVHLTFKTLSIATTDSTNKAHTKYHIKKVVVQTDFNTKSASNITRFKKDTLGIEFINKDEIAIKPEIIRRNVLINKGETYNYKLVDVTYQKLSNLGVFAYVNIGFIEEQDSLIMNIQLSPAPKHSLSVEAKGTNTSGNLGISASFEYSNKNTFKGAEKLNFLIDGGSEVQSNSFIFDSLSNTLNTIEFGPELRLTFPTLFIPKKWNNNFTKLKSSGTEFSVSYNYQERLEYTRHLTLFDYSYQFSLNERSKHDFAILEISTSKFDNNSPIIVFADTTDNEYYQNSFRSYINFGNHYSFTVNQANGYFKTDIQLAGNMLSLLNNSSLMTVNENGQHELLGIAYSQYLRTFFDYRKYKSFKNRDQIAFRTELGFAVPLDNNDALPFDKSFFSGGSNSLRAFRNRTVGPGSYYQNPDSLLTQIGDIKLEFNLEYRFDLNSWLEGALFVDAGNIWLYNEDEENKPGGHFKWNSFYKELATGAGAGIRMDLSFFLFRLDWSVPIVSPANVPNYASDVINNTFNNQLSRSQFSIGIGYPF